MSDQATPSSKHPILTEISSLWWLPLLRGIMMVVLGTYAMFQPGMTVATFVQVFGFFLAFDGILAIVAGVMGQVPSRGWTIIRGVLALIVGGAVMANPVFVAGFAAITFVYVLGFSAILAGVLEIVAAIRDRKEIQGEGWMILGGAISVIFGLFLLSTPLASAAMMVRIIGAVSIIAGIASVVFSLRLRGLKQKLSDMDAPTIDAEAAQK